MRKLYALMTLAGLLPLGASAADVTVYGKVNTSIYYEDYSVREIAEILKHSESNVKVRLSRGRALLKDSLKEEWENDE